MRKHAETEVLEVKNEIVAELMDLHRQGLVPRRSARCGAAPPWAMSTNSALPAAWRNTTPAFTTCGPRSWRQVISGIAPGPIVRKRSAASSSGSLRRHCILPERASTASNRSRRPTSSGCPRCSRSTTSGSPGAVIDEEESGIRVSSELRKDPLFAVGIRQDLRQNKVSPLLTEILRHAPHLKWIEEQFEIWIDQQNVLNKNRDGLRLLLTYLSRLPLDPARSELDMLSEPVLRPMLDYAKTWQTPTTRINAVSKIQAFAKSLADNISANGRKKVELGLRDIDVQRFSKSNRPVNSASSAHSEVRARPMPVRFHHMLRDIISENDFAWPKWLVHRQSGKPLHWITWFDPETGTTRPVFCEVLPRMLLLHLELPLRNVQVRRLDSGEGDLRVWDPATGRWKPASGKHAGHWDRARAKNPRGVSSGKSRRCPARSRASGSTATRRRTAPTYSARTAATKSRGSTTRSCRISQRCGPGRKNTIRSKGRSNTKTCSTGRSAKTPRCSSRRFAGMILSVSLSEQRRPARQRDPGRLQDILPVLP